MNETVFHLFGVSMHPKYFFRRIQYVQIMMLYKKIKLKYKAILMVLIVPLVFVVNLTIFSNVALANTAPAVNIGLSKNTSINWSGYLASNGPYSGIGASWTIPTISGTTGTNLSADDTWVGIGGVISQDLIQAGTQAMNEGNGSISYTAWYELLPSDMVQVPLAVSSGNSITVSLSENSSNLWTINFHNNTTNQSYSTTVSYVSSNSSAEWIEEMPTLESNNSLIPLDNFGTIQFTGGYVTQNNSTLNISQSGAESLTMVNSSNQALAIPSSLDSSGSDFSVSRTNVATSISTNTPSTFSNTHTGWHRTGVGIRNFYGNFRKNNKKNIFGYRLQRTKNSLRRNNF